VPKNQVHFSSGGIRIEVNNSASPIIFSFPASREVKGFTIEGEFLGLPKFQRAELQGTKGNDDYPLRFGFILPGEKKMSALESIFAAPWVRRLFQKARKGMGISHIQFYNVTQDHLQMGRSRQHPKSELLREENFALVEKDGAFLYKKNFPLAFDALGVWINVDGDDTKSKFTTILRKINLY
jgi:hypothetical protein